MASETPQPTFRGLLKFLSLLMIIAGGVVLGRFYYLDIEAYRQTLISYPAVISGPVFVFIYVVSTLLIIFGPKDVLRISSALIFGAKMSAVFVTVAELINAAVLFFMARVLGREYMEKRFKFCARRNAYEPQHETSLFSLLALRTNPLVPFRFMDIGFGLTNLSFFKYLVAIVLATPLRVYWLQMIIEGVGGSILKNPRMIVDYLISHPVMIKFSAFYFLLVLGLTAAALLARVLRRRWELERDA
jgi:uncharacterized membrane protein YdjX (TVP38/TMEM64 family)